MLNLDGKAPKISLSVPIVKIIYGIKTLIKLDSNKFKLLIKTSVD